MNNEKYNKIIDEVYERYWDSIKTSQYDGFGPTSIKLPTLTKQEFINKCKSDSKFSEKWGLKIEERELSLEEKEWQLEKTNCINDIENDRIIYGHEWEKYIQEQYEGIQSNQGIKIPTKLITVTYNNETIEVYE